MAPAGTVTFIEVALAEVTVPRVAPKKTILFAAVVLKPLPVIVTEEPIVPLVGEKLVIDCENDSLAIKIRLVKINICIITNLLIKL